MAEITFHQVSYALLGGLIPALIWLFFWLREDLHPEPKRLILKAFWGGIIAVPLALALEAALYCAESFFFLHKSQAAMCGSETPLLGEFPWLFSIISLWSFAFAEEYVKYKSAKHYVLHGQDFDEPVDAMIYLITVALGFAAFENFFFLFSAFHDGIFQGLVISNLRFLGATLLHALSSAIVGYGIALAFYNKRTVQRRDLLWGLLGATLLHGIFNSVITSHSETGGSIQMTLAILSITGVFIIFAFDRVKKMRRIKFNE